MPHPSDGGRTDGEGVRPLFPLGGPVISGTTHLGPAGYYALAIPTTLGRSVTAVVATIALLAALRFPLAYLFGRDAFDPRTGLAFAILLALPGVRSLASFWIAHPSVAPAFALAAAPFLPLAAGWREHVASVLDLSARMSDDAAAMGARAFAAVASNLAWRVPDQVVGTWIAADGRALVVWRAYAAVLYAAAAAGAVLAIARGEERERQSGCSSRRRSSRGSCSSPRSAA